MCKADDPAVVNKGHVLLGGAAHVRLLQGGGLAQRLHGLGQTLYHTVLLLLIPSSVQERRPHVGQSHSKLKQLFEKVSPNLWKVTGQRSYQAGREMYGKSLGKDLIMPLQCCGTVTPTWLWPSYIQFTEKCWTKTNRQSL